VAGRLGGLQVGERADLVRFRMEDGVVRVVETFLGGARVWSAALQA